MKGSGAGSPWAALGGGWVCAAGGLKSWLQAGDLTVVGVPRIRSAACLVLAMRPQQAPVSGKVFIQRDYSSGTRCQFQTKFPAELENRVRIRAPRTCSGVGRQGVRADPRPPCPWWLWEGQALREPGTGAFEEGH